MYAPSEMIFVGDGALLQEALRTTLARGHTIDSVFGSSENLRPFCVRHRISFELSNGLNEHPERIRDACTDGIAFSIDNTLLLKRQFLDSVGVTFFGVHSGIIPIHRGNPIVASIFAILEGCREYGVSLFKLDPGIDTGEVLAIERFPVSAQVRLHELIVESSLLCHQVFAAHLDGIVRGQLRGQRLASANTKTYSLRDLAALESQWSHPNFERATDFGPLDGLLPEERGSLLRRLRSRALHETSSTSGPAEGPRERALRYWEGQLSHLPILSLSSRQARPDEGPKRRSRHAFTLGDASTERLRAAAAAHGTTILPVLLGAFLSLVGRYTGQSDLSILTTASLRKSAPPHPVVLRANLSGSPSVSQWVSQVAAAYARATEFGLPARDLEEILRRVAPGGSAEHLGLRFHLFDSDFDATRAGPWQAWGSPDSPSPFGYTEQSWTLFDRGLCLEGIVEYDAGRFEEVAIARIASHYVFLLDQMLERPGAGLLDLDLLTPAEQTTLVHGWNETRAAFATDYCVHQRVEEQAARTPDSIALVDPLGNLTFRELNERANRLAHYLLDRGATPDMRIGICVERGADMVVGALGILKSGAAVLPIDPNYPGQRIAFMLEDAQVHFLLTQRSLDGEGLLPEGPWDVVVMDRALTRAELEACPVSDPASAVTPRDLAYVIYTSGSTGKPKGVMVEHRSAWNAFAATQEAHAVGPGVRFLGLASFGSDTAFWQLLAPLCFGATVVLSAKVGDPREILDTIDRHGVTIIDLVPSLLGAVLDEIERGKHAARSLRVVVSGGEPLTSALLERALTSLPGVALFNSYGPTETSCQVTFHRCLPDRTVSIGTPLANTRLYILGANGKPLPPGIAGEITIGGLGVARGYLNRPELTEAKFLRDPFSSDPSARMYATGDVGRYLENGEIEYLGRTDQQIKINGFRVELGEIEGALRAQAGVRDAVVVVDDAHEGRHLVGYVLVGSEESASGPELRNQLRRQLPSYIVPRAIVPVQQWPLTPHGKIDRAALPRPGARPSLVGETASPRNDIERRLAEIWGKLLGLARVGIHDDFFAVGGHSLLALRLIAEIRRYFGKELTLRSIFQLPTIAELADFLASGNPGEVDVRPTREELLRDARLPPGIVAQPPALREVLLTGGTGFLGRHLLHVLLSRTAARVHCLVRASNRQEAITRIAAALARTSLPEDWSARVEPLIGDLTLAGFGVPPDVMLSLAERVDAVFHLGAVVNHVAPYASLFDANAKGTSEVLRFAVSARTKPVHFVSTVDVVGPQARMGSAREPLLCEEPPLLAEPYTLTKWVADQWVAQASSRGIPVCIYRTGYIGPHSKTGDANASGWFETYLRTVMKLRSIPADFPTVGVTPVDSIAEAIFDLSRRPDSPHHAFRLIDDERRVTRETIVGLAASLGCRCEVIPSESWRERLVEYCAAHPSDPAALLGPYLDTVGDRVHERGPEPTSPAAPAAFSTDELPKTESGLARFLSAATRGEVPRRTAAGTRTPDRMAPNDA